MELSIKDSGEVMKDMGMGHRFGQMELNMKVIGETTKLMERENSGMLMEMFLMV
jgi:hypothetical protein